MAENKVELTPEQIAAIDSRGKTIVSASAGSGKTFVMIEKLTRAIQSGADLDSVLAVTFTKKAAAQMKDKLRAALIKKVETAEGEAKERIKKQISKIPSSNISTIHSFCSKILRTYFYALGIDGGFDIMADEDALAGDLKARALENIFERRYESDDEQFIHLLKRFAKKRSDNSLKRLILESYSSVRNVANYREMLTEYQKLYTDAGFKEICNKLWQEMCIKLDALSDEINRFGIQFQNEYFMIENYSVYQSILFEMQNVIEQTKAGGLFGPELKLTEIRKPRDYGQKDKEAGELFKQFKADISKRYAAVRADISNEACERDRFFQSGKTAEAFSRLILEFDEEYTEAKREENKLDYNDLEHLTLQLLQNEDIRAEINSGYEYVFVDEYQDVNPVQEEIISAMGREVFLVGDVKQAIYGFRGSKSVFFTQKFKSFDSKAQNALKLTSNFRSCATVLNFVNKLFSKAMTKSACDIAYTAEKHQMTEGAKYPSGYGAAQIHIFGEEQKEDVERGVYSVTEDGRDTRHTREGLAVLKLVKRALGDKDYRTEADDEHYGQHFSLKDNEYVNTQPGDICILTRKNKGGSTEGIVRALTDGGYSLSGAQESNICALPEVREMLDILSLIDNAEQDIPLVTAMLSPLGGFSEDELAAMRIAFKREGRLPFRRCVERYLQTMTDPLAEKLYMFAKMIKRLRDLSEILTVGELIDIILEHSGLEAKYSAGGGEKLKNVLKLAAEGPKLTLSAFLNKIKMGGYDIKAPSSAPSDSIKIMTMHAAKGLEFPVVIIADICRTFKGMDYSELPFDDEYGFAPKCFDPENMLVYPTLLRRLIKLRADKEELKNELNLFYVACTRAMCKLHIVAEEVVKYSPAAALEAKKYADIFDMSAFSCEYIEPHPEVKNTGKEVTAVGEADEALAAAVGAHFMQPYSHAYSVELPVKSSATAIIKSMKDDEPYYAEHQLFPEDVETGAERGTAYHRFLELCDFAVKSREGIEKELQNLIHVGKITPEQAKLLSVDELYEIVNMSVFADLEGATLWREREFLCRLKASDVLGVNADDFVLMQGAIDLLAAGSFGVRIIDYKYSHKSNEQLISTYSRQLELYKKVVSVILHVPEQDIGTVIINICRRTQIVL